MFAQIFYFVLGEDVDKLNENKQSVKPLLWLQYGVLNLFCSIKF